MEGRRTKCKVKPVSLRMLGDLTRLREIWDWLVATGGGGVGASGASGMGAAMMGVIVKKCAQLGVCH